MNLLCSSTLIFLSIISYCECSVIERRCRCVCPHELEGITDNQTVFQKEVKDSDECNCITMLNMAGVIGDESICLQCDCQYESRNTLVIKIVIYGLLVVIFFMSLYAFIVYPIIYVKCIRNSNDNSYEPVDENSPTFEARLRRFQRQFQQRVQEQRERYR